MHANTRVHLFLDLEYQPCHNGCTETCEDLLEKSENCQNSPIEGCFCPNNEVKIN